MLPATLWATLLAGLRRDADLPLHLRAAKLLRAGTSLATAPIYLRGCTKVGGHVRTRGRPVIDNRGVLEIGAGAHLGSIPLPIELRTGPKGKLVIGPAALLNFGALLSAERLVTVGAGAMIAPYCIVADTDATHDAPLPIEIGEQAWVAARVTVRPGARIGARAIIGAGSVVEGEIPADAIAVGVPARVIRQRDDRPHKAASAPPQQPKLPPVKRSVLDRLRWPGGLALGPLGGCAEVGEGLVVTGWPHVEAWGRLELGRQVTIHSLPAPVHLQVGPEGVLRLGNGVVLEHGAGLSAQSLVTVGAGARIGSFALVLDSAFHSTGDLSRAPPPRPVSIGEGAVIGAWTIVMPGARVGAGAHVAPASVVLGDVPAGRSFAGVPAVEVATA